ncbi:MAG: amidohydrolase family protein [Fibrobacterota bacterium]
MTSGLARFDAHCHLFNLKYLFLEAGDMLLDAVLGSYPHEGAPGEVVPGSIQQVTAKGKIRDFLRWLKGLEEACVGSEEEHLDAVLAAGRKSWGAPSHLAAIPLMMDVYYMFAPILYADSLPVAPMPKKSRLDVGVLRWGKALMEVEVLLHGAGIRLELVEFVRDSLHAKGSHPFDPHAPQPSYHDTRGFAYHRHRLEELKFRRPAELYPFFAVDPRRPGVVEAVVSGEFVGKGKPFQGVKLYPRMGYDPACRALEPLFAWCDKNRIPIVSHCAAQGFPPVGGHDAFGLPSRFERILARHPDLIIDFAHFGLYEPAWADQIVDSMQRYEHVYSDLACYTREEQIPAFRAAYWDKPLVRERTMFGTDFDVFYLVGIGRTLDSYHRAFLAAHNPGAFTDDDMESLTSTVPGRFLSTVV